MKQMFFNRYSTFFTVLRMNISTKICENFNYMNGQFIVKCQQSIENAVKNSQQRLFIRLIINTTNCC